MGATQLPIRSFLPSRKALRSPSGESTVRRLTRACDLQMSGRFRGHHGPPANWSTSTSRSSAVSPTAAATKPLGRQASRARRSSVGFDYVHSAVDDHSRLAYGEIHPGEKAATCAAFLRRAAALLHHLRHRPHRAGPDRQRMAIPQELRLAGAPGRPRRGRQAHRHPPAADQRQSRTLQPHPARRMGLPAALHHQLKGGPQPWQTSAPPTTTTAATPHSAAAHRSAV